MTDDLPFTGKLALVTGASRGIGAATAEALGRAGAHVILTARTASGLEAVEETIHAAGGSATIAPLDLTDLPAIPKFAAAVSERWPALDMLILNGAMLGSLSPVEHLDAKELAKIFATNVFASQAMIAAFDPMLRRSAKADVVGLTSSVGASPRAFWGGYGASKAAFENLLLGLWRRNRSCRQTTPPADRPRRDPHPNAPERLSGAKSRRRVKAPDVVAEAILKRSCSSDAATGRSRARSTKPSSSRASDPGSTFFAERERGEGDARFSPTPGFRRLRGERHLRDVDGCDRGSRLRSTSDSSATGRGSASSKSARRAFRCDRRVVASAP